MAGYLDGILYTVQYVPGSVNQLLVDDNTAKCDELMYDQAWDSVDGSWS